MRTWEENSGYYCLLVAIFCDLDAAKARMLYEYGPDHPACQRFLKKKLHIEGTEKEDGQWMAQLRQDGFTFEEIANAFHCCPSAVRRRIRKAEAGKQQEERDAPA